MYIPRDLKQQVFSLLPNKRRRPKDEEEKGEEDDLSISDEIKKSGHIIYARACSPRRDTHALRSTKNSREVIPMPAFASNARIANCAAKASYGRFRKSSLSRASAAKTSSSRRGVSVSAAVKAPELDINTKVFTKEMVDVAGEQEYIVRGGRDKFNN